MPANAIIEGDARAGFGIELDEGGLITQSVKVTAKRDKKELRNECGEVITVATYNPVSEVEVEGLMTNGFSLKPGDAFTLANVVSPAVVGNVHIEEVSTDMSNEDFAKVTIKGMAYEGL